VLCEQFNVCRSTYKYWRGRRSVINADKIKLRALVSEKHKLSNGSAGSRTIAAIVPQDGVDLSRYRARRLMKDLGLVSCQLPKHAYKKALKPLVAIPNHLSRQLDVSAPNQVWCGDVTYIWTGQRWSYLAVVMDLFYQAFRKFGQMLQDPSDLMTFPLNAGECIVLDNHRIAHGRASYLEGSGARHLRGCYVDRGELRSAYRVLRRQHPAAADTIAWPQADEPAFAEVG